MEAGQEATARKKLQTIEIDWHCPSCRYNLRGLPSAVLCPECGRCVEFSSQHVFKGDPLWRKSFSRGSSFQAMAILALFVALMSEIALSTVRHNSRRSLQPWTDHVGSAIVGIAGLAWSIGLWMSTKPSKTHSDRRIEWKWHLVTTVCATVLGLWMLAFVAMDLRLLVGGRWPFIERELWGGILVMAFLCSHYSQISSWRPFVNEFATQEMLNTLRLARLCCGALVVMMPAVLLETYLPREFRGIAGLVYGLWMWIAGLGTLWFYFRLITSIEKLLANQGL